MQTVIHSVMLKMWEKKELPRTEMVAGKRVKVGDEKEEFTSYSFCDEFGTKLLFLSKGSAYRRHEGQQGTLTVKLEYDDFKKRNKISLVSFIPA